ncbi:helix-turn-helix domain-containing protein [Actinophytocola sp. KF-1]
MVLTLVSLRSNAGQTMLAGWFGISQATVSRICRAMLPLLEQVTCLPGHPLSDVLAGRLVVVDGTIVPVGNRRTDRATHEAAPTTGRRSVRAGSTSSSPAHPPSATSVIRPRRKRPGHADHDPATQVWNRSIASPRMGRSLPRRRSGNG